MRFLDHKPEKARSYYTKEANNVMRRLSKCIEGILEDLDKKEPLEKENLMILERIIMSEIAMEFCEKHMELQVKEAKERKKKDE